MRSWKTTTSAVFTAVAMFVLFSPSLFQPWPWVLEVAKFASVGGLAAFGIFSKDSNVSGDKASGNKDDATK